MNFIRQTEILIGPLAEGKDGNPAQALRLFSDGSPQGLRVAFRVQKSSYFIPNFSTISIWNLNEDTRAALVEGNKQIFVKCGWANSGSLPLIFAGGVLSAFSERQGVDIVTKINALTMGDALSKTVCSFTFKNGMYVVDCLLKIISLIGGVKVDTSSIKITNEKISIGGISFAGQVSDLLNMMGRQYGFSWSIQDGIFQAVGDSTTLDGNPVVLDGANGSLINVSPLLVGPKQILNGVKIRCALEPRLAVNKIVTVVNSTNSGLDNDYQSMIIDHFGDTYSNEWYTEIQSLFTR